MTTSAQNSVCVMQCWQKSPSRISSLVSLVFIDNIFTALSFERS